MKQPFRRRHFLRGTAAVAFAGISLPVRVIAGLGSRELSGDPGNYRELLRDLKPGDTLVLEPGEYRRGLPIHGLTGTAEQPIMVTGPSAPGRAVFVARPGSNTVSIIDSAHVVLRDLVLDGQGRRVDAVKAEGHARWAHHITLERLKISGHGTDQQNVGISTKCPAWGWVVRGCAISGAGTGMYFGDSDGSAPFFDSVIESNQVTDPVGYCMQVKHQFERPSFAPAPEAAMTVIRGNCFSKSRRGATELNARPNVLVGHWPLFGPGARDRYLIYGNLFFDNPNESLFQGEGNIALYNNILFNPHGEGVRIQPHNDKPREVAVFRNTIVAAALGIEFVGGEPGYARYVEHNFVFGKPPIHSDVAGDNRIGRYEQASAAFARLLEDIDSVDLTPVADSGNPDTALDPRLRVLPSARDDYLGRSRDRDSYGACLWRSAEGGRRCGPPAFVAVMR